ncbi:MAG: carbohydrate ABC transporter permease [Acetivibrionales bacterium]
MERYRVYNVYYDCGAAVNSASVYYEASKIDGANSLQNFWYVTLPLMMPTLTITTVLNMLYGLKVFDIVFVLTNGGPGRVTEVLYTCVFREFSQGKYALSTRHVILDVCGYGIYRTISCCA